MTFALILLFSFCVILLTSFGSIGQFAGQHGQRHGDGERKDRDSHGIAKVAVDKALRVHILQQNAGCTVRTAASHDLRKHKTQVDGAGKCQNKGDTLTIFKYNTTYNVYLAATIPQAYITNGTRTINMMLIALAAVLVVVSVFLTLLVYRSVMHPIDNMVAACNAKSDEEIGLKINDPSPDELGFLARTIDNMVNEIGLLAQRWSDDQRKMRELELQTLQYQINPHFLFNTLNTLKWIATLNHVTPVSHGIDALSSLLQSTLIKKDELIPFDDELRNLKNYCDIQQLRYAGRFEMEYQIEDAAGYWTVPRFILQPLVENSILHGTADEDDFVTITVRATVSENLLTIHISDTGCGFDPSAIKEKNSERFSGIGLSNVDERMRLHYGNEYGLTIESAPGIGTQCILCIPNEAIR